MIRHPVFLALGLLVLLAWAPLPFGSVTPWATALVELVGFVVLAFVLLLAPANPIPQAARQVALALVAVAALGAAQSLAWPAALVRVVSSEHLRLARETASMLELPQPAFVALSLAPATSRRIALVWLLGAATLVSGALIGRSRRGRRAILGVLAASALFQIGFGLTRWGRSSIWGVELPWRGTGLSGTFVNRNHLATYLLVVGATLFALVWWLQRRRSRRHWLGLNLFRLGPALLAWIGVFIGLALTGSRAGLLAGLAGLVAQVTLVSLGSSRRRVILASVGGLVLAMSLLVFLGFRSGFQRLANPTEGGGFRLEAMGDTVKLFARFPVTGVGLGGFRAAFPLAHEVKRPYAGAESDWWHAHNDWLELAATTGVVGFAIAIFGVVALARGLRQSWKLGERSEDRAAALAAIGACVSIGLQELLDFGLTMPANSVTLGMICGAALAVPLAKTVSDASTVTAGEDLSVPEQSSIEAAKPTTSPALLDDLDRAR